ncbi:carbohydrate porin [Acetobacter sacchari]|uniref:Carbohydrate porin n=1 Tax=Acetobacter sacchari TaxID=2661687 RepID=A0ABS3LWF1_9PROT|nr:carbohydrate porin [Acetobacter sacchari]MBO1360232.1 carbohydrate porin [Acetobacter sacchari]
MQGFALRARENGNVPTSVKYNNVRRLIHDEAVIQRAPSAQKHLIRMKRGFIIYGLTYIFALFAFPADGATLPTSPKTASAAPFLNKTFPTTALPGSATTQPYSPDYSLRVIPQLHYLPPPGSGFTPSPPTGPLTGAGTYLSSHGIYLRALAVDEFARNVTGGQKKGYGNSFAIPFGADIDFDKLIGLRGSSLHITINKSIGNSLASDYTENTVSFQTRYKSYHNFRLAAFAYTQKLFSERLIVTGGRISALTFFDESSIYCNFQNNAFCFKPLSIALQNGAWNFFPFSSWGGFMKIRPTNRLHISGGIFEYDPTSYPTNGWNFGTSTSTGISWGAEIGLHSQSVLDSHAYHIAAGAFGNTAAIADPYLNQRYQPKLSAGGASLMHSGQTGFYIQGDIVTMRFGENHRQNVTFFGGTAYEPENYLKFKSQSTLGFIVSGLFASRPNDTLGLAGTYYQLGDRQRKFLQLRRLRAGGHQSVYSDEGIIELNYNALIMRGVHLMPNIQYVISPDNMLKSAYPYSSKNILTFGIRLTVEAGAVLGFPVYPGN